MAPSRALAQQAIADGSVTVGGANADKPARLVAPGDAIVITGPRPRFVGRGGEKLAAALSTFGLAVAGHRAVDVGASTGGFTDCLLQAGAKSVVAIDVGRNQLHERLLADSRVDSRERTDIRRVTAQEIGGAVQILVADVSFISLQAVLDSLLGLVAPGGDIVLLVKPQFEAGRVEVSRGRGVIADPAVWRRTLGEVCGALGTRKTAIMGAMVSPLRGADGNVEFLLHAVAPGAGSSIGTLTGGDIDRLVGSVGERTDGTVGTDDPIAGPAEDA